VVVFFSHRNEDALGNIFAMCIMVYVICYALVGASLCIAAKKDESTTNPPAD
jgi:NADH:ubiquinone oxidoreductase subunit K